MKSSYRSCWWRYGTIAPAPRWWLQPSPRGVPPPSRTSGTGTSSWALALHPCTPYSTNLRWEYWWQHKAWQHTQYLAVLPGVALPLCLVCLYALCAFCKVHCAADLWDCEHGLLKCVSLLQPCLLPCFGRWVNPKYSTIEDAA